jgi:hypothetical protein
LLRKGVTILLLAKFIAILTALLAAVHPVSARSADPTQILAPCIAESIGLDPSLATTAGDVVLGKAWGQTFVAPDTLIQSVTVWRIPQEATNDFSEMKFWLTSVNPITGNVRESLIQEGPSQVFLSDDASQPTRIQYTFDPAIHLPQPGRYAFWIQVCTGYADLLIDTNNDYPGGYLWQTNRSSLSGCILAGGSSFPGFDLAFEVVFCTDAATPTRRDTWGDLKVRYR